MRHFLISTLFLSLVAGCSSVNIGPHRIDVQQGNALDQESVARLKPGLSRSQVRFLLGTPLVVDPFRSDRWDYVYMYYKAGKLAEQKRITLFFEGDTLMRIEGDVPAAEPAVQPEPAVQSEPKAEAMTVPAVTEAKPAPALPAPQAPKPESSIVPSLSSPKDAPAQVDSRLSAELSLHAETVVEKVQPDVIPAFPEPRSTAVASDDPVLKSLNEWADAWVRRDEEAYLAAYAPGFVPQDGDTRSGWEKRRRLLLGVAKDIDLKIDSPSVVRAGDGAAVVTFNQHYRSDKYSDAVVKQLRMVERDGRWLIVEEKVLSVLRGAQS
jgi:outer membrane protein assembly factor BamE